MVSDLRFRAVLATAAGAPPGPSPLVFGFFTLFGGYRGHFLQRECSQLLQILSAPKVVWQRWQTRWMRIRIFFSTRSASGLIGEVHSPGSKVNPYFANSARALSSRIALLSAAVVASHGLPSLVVLGFAVCWSDVVAGSGLVGSSSIAVSSMGAGLNPESAVSDEK